MSVTSLMSCYVHTLSGECLLLDLTREPTDLEHRARVALALHRMDPEQYPLECTEVAEIPPYFDLPSFSVWVCPQPSVTVSVADRLPGKLPPTYGPLAKPTRKLVYEKVRTYRVQLHQHGQSSFEARPPREDRPPTEHELAIGRHGLPTVSNIVVFYDKLPSNPPHVNVNHYYECRHEDNRHVVRLITTGCTDGNHEAEAHRTLEEHLMHCRHSVKEDGSAWYLSDEARAAILRWIRLNPY